jgi:hypothetical protein
MENTWIKIPKKKKKKLSKLILGEMLFHTILFWVFSNDIKAQYKPDSKLWFKRDLQLHTKLGLASMDTKTHIKMTPIRRKILSYITKDCLKRLHFRSQN